MKQQIALITPVPELVETVIQNSILRQATERGVVDFFNLDLRQFGEGNYRQIDDVPYGGGSGMVMMAGPLFKALDKAYDLVGEGARVVYPSPQGQPWNHDTALENSLVSKLIFICGHYKGIDERVLQKYTPHEYTLGDFILSGGEIPALVMIDSIVRLIPGVLNTYESALTDSFPTGLLDAPYFTKPREIEGREVPAVLLSGHHKKIAAWRAEKRHQRTQDRRPDLWEKYLQKIESSRKS